MSFNLFGPTTVCDIRVGYISTDRGFVDGVSRYEANQYAQLNPGTQFIFRNRDIIRYLNINEVNSLTPDDLLPKRIPTNGCENESKNTFGLDLYDDNGNLKIDEGVVPPKQPPRVYINGGGGVGAAANAVVGQDGSLLAVDVIDGGYGYQYAPQVDIVDVDEVGSGAVAISSLCPPDRVGTLQTFEREEDFEEYDFTQCAPEITDFGRRIGANGEPIGVWDPTLYAALRVDPIRREIREYQEFLTSIKNGWWNTRKAKPIEIIGEQKTGNVKYDVQHWAWGGDLITEDGEKKSRTKPKDFVEVEFKVYTQGGQDRGLMFTFIEKNGDHRFKIKADSFPDGAKGQKVKIKIKPNSIYIVNASGQFRGGGVEQGLLQNFGRKAKELDKRFTDGTRIFTDFTKSANDNDDLQVEATQGKFRADNRRKYQGHSTYDLTYKLDGNFTVTENYNLKKVVPRIDDSFMNRFAISPVPPSNVPGSDFAGIQYSFIYEENFPYDGEYIFKAKSDNIGDVYIDNERVLKRFQRFRGDMAPEIAKKFIKAGVHKIRCDLYNIPIKEKVKPKPNSPAAGGCPTEIDFKVTTEASFANGIRIPDLNIDLAKERKGKQLNKSFRRRVELGREYDVICTSSSGGGVSKSGEYKIEVADRGRRGRGDNAAVKSVSKKKIKFTDSTSQNDTDAEFEILPSSGVTAEFSGTNDDDLKLIVKGNGNVTLRLKWDDDKSKNGKSVGNLKVAGEAFRQTGDEGEVEKTIKVGGDGSRNKANIRLRTSGPNVLQMEESTDNDWQDLVCTVSCGRFIKINGNRCKLIFDAPEKRTGKSTSSKPGKAETVFNTLDFIDKADRKLWKMNPSSAGRDGNFLNRYGVLPFNPAAVGKEDVEITKTIEERVARPQRKPTATIERDGDKLFLKVTGGGRVKINFKLKADDNLRTSGVFAREVTIKTDDNDLKFKRDIREVGGARGGGRGFLIGKEKEKIKGSGTFTGGKTYPIKMIGGSPTSGFKPIDKTTVGFDDDITNGYDENGSLEITKITVIEESETRYKTEQREVTKTVKKYPSKPNASTDAYAGTHLIRWESVDFPVDGNYIISTMVDDNAKIFIGNRDGKGKKEIGNGLRSIEKGGDEVIIEKKGFSQGSSTGKSVDTRFFRKGKYRIRVELEQIPGKPLAKGNPMGVAIEIKSPAEIVQDIVSPKSWVDNPMGIALTIDPPLPPIPQEPIPRAPGRCPRNPIWSTRFPDGREKWWPVTHSYPDGSKSWSKFMNRFAVSPIPPLATKGTAQGGIVFSNSWNVEVPYDGFYGMKGTVDNGGRILVDGKVILQGGYFPEAQFKGPNRTLEGFASETPQTVKFPLTKGNHTVTVEVENRAQTKQKKIKRTIFNTADWAVEQAIPVTQNNTYDVAYIDLHPRNKKLKVSGDRKTVRMLDGGGDDTNAKLIITSGDATFSDDGRKISGKGVVRARLEWNDDPNNKGIAVSGVVINGVKLTRSSVSITGDKTFPIKVADRGSLGRGDRAAVKSVSNKTIKFTDSTSQMDTDAEFKILSTDPGVTAKFTGSNDSNLKLVVKGNGNVNLQLEWDDDPRRNGESVGNIKVAGETFKQTAFKNKKGDVKKTITVRSNTVNQFSRKGDDTKNIDLGSKQVSSGGGLSGGTTKRGVKYTGPELASYLSGRLGPFITPKFDSEEQYLAEFQGTTWNMKWESVTFPISAQYRLRTEGDDIVKIRVDGQEVGEAKTFEGVREFKFTATEGKRTVEIELFNQGEQRGPLATNPTNFNAIIDVDSTITVPAERSWKGNPVGISAIMIPPPCPLETKGLGKVCDIVPLEPGNGYTPPQGPGYPVVPEISKLIPVDPGINYGPEDLICIVREDGTKVCFEPNLGPFGTMLPLDIPDIPTTTYPNVQVSSPTGINARFRPVISIRRDPLDVDPDDIIQVTDLVGLKRTGYVGGREYFGAVFYKDGVRFAGYYETAGQLIQVYDTLQESIDGEVTTRPSAILRQGTDVTSNDPRLNIPGTPDSLS